MAQETKLKGYKVPHESGSALPSSFATVKAEFRPGSFRSGTERESEVALGNDELIEVEFEDGLRCLPTAPKPTRLSCSRSRRLRLEQEGRPLRPGPEPHRCECEGGRSAGAHRCPFRGRSNRADDDRASS